MNCHREDELLDALGRRFVSAEMEAHVVACTSCAELRSVAGALLDDRSVAVRDAAVPASATMWWRLQMRHRHEVEAASRRWLFAGQAITLVIAIALGAMLLGGEVTGAVRHAMSSIRLSTPVFLTLAAMLIGTPIAGYIAIKQK